MPSPEMSPPADQPTIAIEIDEILTSGKHDSTYTFAPVRPGAKEFLDGLRSRGAYIMIWTERCNNVCHKEMLSELRRRVLDWLTDHDLPFDQVYVGTSKPEAELFILPNCRKLALCPQDADKLAERCFKAADSYTPVSFTPPAPVVTATPPHGAPQNI